MLYSLKKFDLDEVARERLRIITFYKEYGEKATVKAFGADRKTIYIWRRRLKQGGFHLVSLVPSSTQPKRLRRMVTDTRILEFIKSWRERYPRLGKEKIKPLLDNYCRSLSIASISESTIGKVIKRNHYFFQKIGKVYHNPNCKWNEAKREKRLRVKHSPSHLDFGHIQSDTIFTITNGIKNYFYSAIDTRSKFGLVLNYRSLNSRNMKDFYTKFKSVYPGEIKDWQTDNGLEHLGEMDYKLKQEGIPHYFTYPRCPKINGVVERFNRTLRENLIDVYIDLIHDKILFNRKLSEFVIFYNTQRAHNTLGGKSPLDFLISEKGLSKNSVTYTLC